jgi:hypothetical protein
MTKHKAGESAAERRYRRVIEHNERMITEHFHLNYDKHLKEKEKLMGEYFRSITATFSDKEMEEAMKIGLAIVDRVKPEDGLSYTEIVTELWGLKTKEDLPGKESIERERDQDFHTKIDHLLYVLQVIVFEFAFNTKKDVAIIPHIKSVKDKPLIFNAARDNEYACEALENWPDSSSYKCGAEAIEKFGGSHKLKSNDYAKVAAPDQIPPSPLNPRFKSPNLI